MAYKNDLIKILGRGELTSKINITVDAYSSTAKATLRKLEEQQMLFQRLLLNS